MNVTDLRSALHEQADTVTDHNAALRLVQVHARVRVARRRRIAGVAALTVGALALVSAVAVLPNRAAEPDNTGPADPSDPAPVPTIQHENFVSHSGEFDLIAAKVGEPGQNTLDLTIPAHRGEVHVSMVCYGANGRRDGYWVSGYAGDSRPARPHSDWCGDDPNTPAVPAVTGSAPGPWNYGEGLTLQPADGQVTFHLELTREVDENGVPLDHPDSIGDYVPVSHPDVVLGAAVYTVADPVTTVAGTEIRPLVGVDGQDYAYEEHRLSEPGKRELTWRLEPSAEVRYYDVVASDAKDPDKPGPGVAVSLDGGSCRSGYAFAQFRAGGCLLSPGEPHTITVTIEGEPPKNALLGVVLYGQTG
ncbi:hypothetical protein [Actinophytocola sp.]|jgi:hypothetical protein|uniref:hypothetical protein n=1 Tax=Actinophytocola sp. TaxID=1872138 RepID=UPI002EDB9C0A